MQLRFHKDAGTKMHKYLVEYIYCDKSNLNELNEKHCSSYFEIIKQKCKQGLNKFKGVTMRAIFSNPAG